MRVLVCGASGCVGRAVARALRSRGHHVVEGARARVDGRATLPIDFMVPTAPAVWAHRLADRRVDAVVNCVGILMPARGQSFARVHTEGPAELFRGAAIAGVRRVVQVSALGVGDDPESLATPYLHSKLLAEEALAALPIDGVVVRPSLVYGPGSRSAALFATLASLPVVGLPGRGAQRLAPIHVYELAEAIVRLVERPDPVRGVLELGGGEELTYRAMLARYREATGRSHPLWLPVPMPLMGFGAWLAEALPQRVFSRDTIRLLARGNVPAANATAGLLGREPSTLAHGLAITAPEPVVDVRVSLSPVVAWTLRLSLAVLWLCTAWIGVLLQHDAGAMALAVLVGACALNTVLGLLILWRPSPRPGPPPARRPR
ncbi:MAG: NAD-dependent epimerase/dehydratase family protein [Rhizobacter sp.]